MKFDKNRQKMTKMDKWKNDKNGINGERKIDES